MNIFPQMELYCEVFDMPDYKEMYLTLFHETTKAIHILQAAQQKTEELYLDDDLVDRLIVLTPDDKQ